MDKKKKKKEFKNTLLKRGYILYIVRMQEKTDMRILYSKLYIASHSLIDLIIKYSIIDLGVIPYLFLCLQTFPNGFRKAKASHLLNHSCGVRYHAVTSFV